jgi:hypothetical protein
MSIATDTQLTQIAYYGLKKRSESFAHLYILLGGTNEKLVELAKEFNFPPLSPIKSPHDGYAVDIFMANKRKITRRFLNPFTVWIVLNKKFDLVIKIFLAQANNTHPKWKKMAVRRYSDYLSHVIRYTSLEEATKALPREARQAVIHDAVIHHRNSIAIKLLNVREDLDSTDLKGNSLLHNAAIVGNNVMFDILVEFGSNIEAKGKKSRTPLHYAIRGKHEFIISRLIEMGTSLKQKDSNGESILFYSVAAGHEALVNQLLGAGEDVNEINAAGVSLLHHAYRWLPRTSTIINRILIHPKLEKSPFLLSKNLSYSILSPHFDPFLFEVVKQAAALTMQFGLRHSFEVNEKQVLIDCMNTRYNFDHYIQAMKDYLEVCDDKEKDLWRKTIEVCEWSYRHSTNITKLITAPPYNIVSLLPSFRTGKEAHVVSLAVSVSKMVLIYGNRNTSPYGLQYGVNISLEKLKQSFDRMRLRKYKEGKIYDKIKHKFNCWMIHLPQQNHSIQKSPNCSVIAPKLLIRSTQSLLLHEEGMVLASALDESRPIYKKFSRYALIRSLKLFLEKMKEIDRFSKEHNLSRYDLMQQFVIIEPILVKIFNKCITKGMVEGLELLLPYSNFHQDPDSHLLNAYLHSPLLSFPWLCSKMKLSTPLSNFLSKIEDVDAREFIAKQTFFFKKMEDPDCLIEIYVLAHLAKVDSIQNFLKEEILKIPFIEGKLRTNLYNRFYIQRKDLIMVENTLKDIFNKLKLKNPYNNPTPII